MNQLGFRGAARACATVLLLAGSAALFWGGCEGDPGDAPGNGGGEPCGYADSCFPACAVDGDCQEEGTICRPIGYDEEPSCTLACSQNADCSEGRVCRCPDDAGSGFCDTELADQGPDAGPLNELCTEDYSVAVGCQLLCSCPCSFGDLCYDTTNGTTEFDGNDCRGGCEAAFETFPDCSAELDAYYRCSVRQAQCVAHSEAMECPNGWPYCWGTTPDEACPTERAAVETCASPASWRFFFPLEAAAE